MPAGLAAGRWIVGGIGEPAVAELDPGRDRKVFVSRPVQRDAGAGGVEIVRAPERQDVADSLGVDAGAAVVADSDPGPGAQFDQTQIEPRHPELLGVIGDEIGFPSVAALVVEIIEVMRGDQSERVPVRRLLELGRKQRVLADGENVRTVGSSVGVGLISEAELPVDRELVGRDRLVHRDDIGLNFGLNVRGRVLGRENGVEIVARHLIGMQAKVEHAELKLHPGKIWVVVEHALERADRRLVVAELGLEFGIAESGVEIVRLVPHVIAFDGKV